MALVLPAPLPLPVGALLSLALKIDLALKKSDNTNNNTLTNPVSQVIAVQPLAMAELQAVHEPSATVAQQLKSSLFEVVANWLDGQEEHASASTNGCFSGFDM